MSAVLVEYNNKYEQHSSSRAPGGLTAHSQRALNDVLLFFSVPYRLQTADSPSLLERTSLFNVQPPKRKNEFILSFTSCSQMSSKVHSQLYLHFTKQHMAEDTLPPPAPSVSHLVQL